MEEEKKHNLLRKFDIFLRMQRKNIFNMVKQAKYFSVPVFARVIKMKLRMKYKFRNNKNIIWIGCFPPHQSNIGDHAQTLAVEKFFQMEFPDYNVIKFYRNEVGKSRCNKLVNRANENDLIFIHSSGDFGSRYHKFAEKNITEEDIYKDYEFYKKYSWHDIRKKIILSFPNHNIIQFPVTVYYDDGEHGKATLEQDIQFYKNKKFLALCRELESDAILKRNQICRSRFFPDFVFYLKPSLEQTSREGALLILRTDQESKFNEIERGRIREKVEEIICDIVYKDIHKLPFPISNSIREQYISSIFNIYQKHRIVITDMMHSMIFSVINKTPCIALDDAIPYKISAYKDILGKSVKFAGKIDEIPELIKKALNEPYRETNLSSYFDNFKKDVLEWRLI